MAFKKNTKLISFLVSVLFFACGHKKDDSDDEFITTFNVADVSQFDTQYETYANSLVSEYLYNSTYPTHRQNGNIVPDGDALLWLGVALASLDCNRAESILEGFLTSVEKYNGGFIRIDPPTDGMIQNKDWTSRDMEVGAIFGLAYHVNRCPHNLGKIGQAWRKHLSFITSDHLWPDAVPSKTKITVGLEYALDLMSHKVLGHARPSNESLLKAEIGHILGAREISKNNTAACYPIHLSTLQILLSAKLGKGVSKNGHKQYCKEVSSLDLPLTKWLCKRLDISDYLSHYTPNVWQYEHQRCKGRETPDAKGLHPSLDWLVIYRLSKGD